MDGNDWNDNDQSFVGGQQQYHDEHLQQLQYGGFQQPQHGGQQPFQPFGQQSQGAQQPQVEQQQQQQTGRRYLQNNLQQQHYGAQQFVARSQQAQDGHFVVGGQQNQFLFGSQPPRVQSGAQQSPVDTFGWSLSSASSNGDQNSPVDHGLAATWSSNRPNMSAPTGLQSFAYGLAVTQQTARNTPGQQFLQASVATRGPSGQPSSEGYTAGQSPGNPIYEQNPPRHRPMGGQPHSMTGQRQYIGSSQQFQRIPMAVRNSPGHVANNALSQQILSTHRIQDSQTQFMGGQQQNLANNQYLSPSASHFQPGAQQQYQFGQPQFMDSLRQFSGDSQQFQQGNHRQYASSSLNMSSPQSQHTSQITTGRQQVLPPSSQFQPRIEQNFESSQVDLRGPQDQGQQQFPQGQLCQTAQHSSPGHWQFQPLLGVYQPQDGRGNSHFQQYGIGTQAIGGSGQTLGEFLDRDDEAMDEDDGLYGNQVGNEDGGKGRHHLQALNITGGHLVPNSTCEGQDINRQILEGTMEDPLYQQTLLQVQQWQAQHNVPMTEEQQTHLAVQEARNEDRDTFMGGKRLAELDEDDIGEEALEEAVRDSKRLRTSREPLNFHTNAQRVYVQGPDSRPEPMDVDDGSGDHDQVTSFDLDLEVLGLTAEFKGEFSGETLSLADNAFKRPYEHQVFDRNFRLIESICCDWTFMIEVTKHLRVKDIIMLYSISKTFHNLVNLRFQSTIAAWAQEISPSGWKVFYWKMYGDLTMKDPAGKPWAMPGPVSIPRPPWATPARIVSRTHQVRSVPSLKYLAMIAQRETRTRDILACLARAGHRLPETMHVTLKKMWMLMDMPTNNLRRAFIRNEDIWTPRDLYNAQMFYVKLQMRFNEPLFGPKATVLADTFLGLRDGLNPLWRLLRRKDYLKGEEILQQRLKYFCIESTVQHFLLVGSPYAGVHPSELGNEHKEGWGTGKLHLSRPDELVIEESVRRHLHMDKHIVFMMFWGHVDWKKRLNLVPTEGEMYMSDDELPPLPKTGKYAAHAMWGKCGNVPFEFDNWQPKHAMKARWKTLTRAEKLAVTKDDQDEQLKALPFEKDVSDEFWALPHNSNDRTHPDCSSVEPPEDGELGFQDIDDDDDDDDDVQMGGSDNEEGGSEDSFFAEAVAYDPERERREHLMTHSGAEEGSVLVEYEYIYEDDSLPMPDTIEDEDIIANWDELDPYLQQNIIDEQERLHKQDAKDERTLALIVNDEKLKLVKAEREAAEAHQTGDTLASAGPSHQAPGPPSPYTSPMKKRPKRYKYPGISDPICLALLEKYDRFTPDEFRTDEDGRILRAEQPSSGFNSNSTSPVELSDYEEYDDEDLKALADEEYDSDQVEFDLDSYQKFLARVADDGGFRNPDAGGDPQDKVKEKGKEKARSKGKAIALYDTDSDDEGGYDRDETAHEGDLDDDIPLPQYDFRKF